MFLHDRVVVVRRVKEKLYYYFKERFVSSDIDLLLL